MFLIMPFAQYYLQTPVNANTDYRNYQAQIVTITLNAAD